MKKEIEIPKGCKKIIIEIDDERMLVTYSSGINDREFLCDETGEMEELPGIGDFAIFWGDNSREKAACMNLKGKIEPFYIASDGMPYPRAIKFRNYEQFLKVRGVYGEDEP